MPRHPRRPEGEKPPVAPNALLDAEAAEMLAAAEATHRRHLQQIRDEHRHRARQAEWDQIRTHLTQHDKFTPIKHYDLIDPSGLLVELAYAGGEAECRLYTTQPHGRNQQRIATYRFNGNDTEPVLPHLEADIKRARDRIRRKASR